MPTDVTIEDTVKHGILGRSFIEEEEKHPNPKHFDCYIDESLNVNHIDKNYGHEEDKLSPSD